MSSEAVQKLEEEQIRVQPISQPEVDEVNKLTFLVIMPYAFQESVSLCLLTDLCAPLPNDFALDFKCEGLDITDVCIMFALFTGKRAGCKSF